MIIHILQGMSGTTAHDASSLYGIFFISLFMINRLLRMYATVHLFVIWCTSSDRIDDDIAEGFCLDVRKEALSQLQYKFVKMTLMMTLLKDSASV